MEAIQRSGKTLVYLAVHPDDYDPGEAYPLVILLHGFGADMADLANLTPALDRKGYVYLCPNAPIGVQTSPTTVGYAWEPPGAIPKEEIPDGLPEPEPLLEVFFDEVMEQYRGQPGRVLLAGFSQGGGLTYRCGLPRPDLFAGLVVMSAGMRDPDKLRSKLPPQREQPIFIAHGTFDNPERAHMARAFLEAEGYSPEYKEYPMGHEISQEVINDLVPWMHQVLPPLKS